MVLQLVSKMTLPKWTLGAKACALHFDGARRLGLVLLNPLNILYNVHPFCHEKE